MLKSLSPYMIYDGGLHSSGHLHKDVMVHRPARMERFTILLRYPSTAEKQGVVFSGLHGRLCK